MAVEPEPQAGDSYRAPDGLPRAAVWAARELWAEGRLSTGALCVLLALDYERPSEGGVFLVFGGDRELARKARVRRAALPELCDELQAALGRMRFSATRSPRSACRYWVSRAAGIPGIPAARGASPLVSQGYQRTGSLVSLGHQTGTRGIPFLKRTSRKNDARARGTSPRTPLPEDGSPHPLRGSPPSPGGIPDVEPQAPQPCAKEEGPSQVAAIREQIWRQFGNRAPVKGAASPGLRMSWGLRPVGAVLAQSIGQCEEPDKSQSDS